MLGMSLLLIGVSIWSFYVSFRLLRTLAPIIQRVGFSGALVTGHGTPLGARINRRSLMTRTGPVEFPHNQKLTLYIEIARRCDVCKKVLQGLTAFRRNEADYNLVVGLHLHDEQDRHYMAQISGLFTVVGVEAEGPFGITPVPYGFVVDPEGWVLAKGLVNDLSDVESLCTQAEEASPMEAVPDPSLNDRVS